MISDFFESLTDFTWVIETGIVSVLLFGEYPYPKKSDFEQD